VVLVGCCRGGRFCWGGEGGVGSLPADSDVVVVEGVGYLLWVRKSVAVVLEFGGRGSGVVFLGHDFSQYFHLLFWLVSEPLHFAHDVGFFLFFDQFF